MANIYAGDVGTVISIDVVETITGIAGQSIKVLKPGGTTATWTAELDGTTAIKHTLEAGDVTAAGVYRLQPYIQNLDGWTGHGATVLLYVHELYD